MPANRPCGPEGNAFKVVGLYVDNSVKANDHAKRAERAKNMAQQLIYDGVDSVPKYRLRCSCGNEKFRYPKDVDDETFWLNLPTSGTIAEYRPGGKCSRLDSHVRA